MHEHFDAINGLFETWLLGAMSWLFAAIGLSVAWLGHLWPFSHYGASGTWFTILLYISGYLLLVALYLLLET